MGYSDDEIKAYRQQLKEKIQSSSAGLCLGVKNDDYIMVNEDLAIHIIKHKRGLRLRFVQLTTKYYAICNINRAVPLNSE